jgi:hypothetical protein
LVASCHIGPVAGCGFWAAAHPVDRWTRSWIAGPAHPSKEDWVRIKAESEAVTHRMIDAMAAGLSPMSEPAMDAAGGPPPPDRRILLPLHA